MKNTTEYFYEKTIEFPNCTARICRPILTEEERNRRMKRIETAAANLLLSATKTQKHK